MAIALSQSSTDYNVTDQSSSNSQAATIGDLSSGNAIIYGDYAEQGLVGGNLSTVLDAITGTTDQAISSAHMTAAQTKFSAGMGYKLSEPVSYIQLFNTSDSPLTIDFSLAIGGVTDNRLTVSGTVNTAAQLTAYSSVNAGSATAPLSLPYDNNSVVALVCTSGTITVNIAAAGVTVTNLELTAGQAWETPIVSGGTVEITGTGKFNYTIAGY